MHNLRVLFCLLLRCFVFLPILCLISFSISNTAFADSAQSSASDRAEAGREKALAAQGMTEDLMGLARRHARASAVSRSPIAAEMVALAEARRTTLAELMAEDPAEVLRLAVPDHVAGRMPAAVQDQLERRLELEGELEVLHVDGRQPGESFYEHILTTPAGERVSLHFAQGLPNALTGNQVRAKGVFLAGAGPNRVGPTDGSLALGATEDLELLACCESSAEGSGAAAPELSNTFGAQNTLVMLVNFQDDPTNKPWTAQQALDLLFGTVSDYFVENSFGQTWLAGDVQDWLTLAIDSTTCAFTDVTAAAEQAALDAGIDLSAYNRHVYITPNNACSFSGIATLGGAPSKTWINGYFELQTIAHEIGHNFGLRHSHAMDCGATTLGTDCTTLEYGDSLDTMGSPDAGHLNTFQKQRLGWLDYGASPPVTTVETDGTYTLAPYASADLTAKALRLPKSVDPLTGATTWYYIEFRQAIGFDSFLADRSYRLCRGDVTDGVVIRLGTESDDNSSYVLHMKPNSCFVERYGFLDWFDPGLETGASFTDSETGMTITTDWTDSAGATVSVSFGPQTCVPTNPSVQLSPPEGPWVEPGTLVTYDVTVTNNDGSACAAVDFDLSAGLPAGWTGVVADPRLTLASGASGTTTLNVTSPAGAADGFYDVSLTAENGAVPTYNQTAAATYVVSATINQPPIAIDDSAVAEQSTPVTVAVLANDSDPEGDPLTVTVVSDGANGSAVLNADDSVTYTPNAGFTGSDSFAYSISDGKGGAASAAVAVTVAANQAPIAVDDEATTMTGQAVTVTVLINDWDPDGDPLTVTAVAAPAKGTVTLNADGTITYTPDPKAKGRDSFSYSISDGIDVSSAVVTVSVKNEGGGNGKGKPGS